MPLACFIVIACLRHLQTGLFFPTPVYAKVGTLRAAIPQGLRYLCLYWTRGAIGPVHFVVFVASVIIVLRAFLSRQGRAPFSIRLAPA